MTTRADHKHAALGRQLDQLAASAPEAMRYDAPSSSGGGVATGARTTRVN